MGKRIFSFIILISIIISLGLYMYHSYMYDIVQETTFPLSNNPEENTTVFLSRKSLFISDLPKTENFNYILIKLVGDQNTIPIKKSKNARKETYDARFDLQNVPNGLYSVEIYCAPKKHMSYVSYIHGQSLRIEVRDSSIAFIEPLIFPRNQEIFSANKYDENTLELYLKPSSNVESDDPAIINLAEVITSGLSSDYEKAKAIHDWVSQNIWYDYDELYSGISSKASALEALASKTGVCIDYSSLTAALCRAVGVPAKLVTGYVLDTSSQEVWTQDLITSYKGNHVWNEVYIDDRWVIIDTSYDSNNCFINKGFSSDTGMKNRKYFDITIEFLSTDRYILPTQLDPLRFW